MSYTRAETLSPVIGGLFFADMVRFPTYWFLRTVDENGIFYSNNYKYGSPGTVLADLMAGGSNKYDNEYLTGTFNLDIEIIEGLKFRGVLSAESRNEHRFTDKHAYLVGTDDGPNWSSPSQAGRGGKYTRSRLPVELVYFEELPSPRDAMRREWQIKQLTRKQKLELIGKK